MASVKKSKILEKADKYIRQKKLKPAIDELLRYVQAAPDDMELVNIINKIGDLFAQMGNRESAIEYFQKSVNHYIREGFFTKAIAILKKILRMDKENIRALEQLAELYTQEGMVQDAKRQYLEIAEKYHREGLTKRALESYRKIVDMDPDNVASRMKLAELFNSEGMQQEAIEQLITLAKTLRDKGKLDEAEKILLKTRKLDIPDPVVDITLAKVLVLKGELGKAEKVLEAASARFTRNPMILELLGDIKMEQGNFDEALKILCQVFQIDNTRDKALRELVNRFLEEKQYSKAWKAAQPLLDRMTRNEEYDDAISLLKSITAKAEHFAPAIQKLAVLYEKNGEKVFQISALEKLVNAYKMDGNVTGAEKALKQLVQLDPMNYDYKSALKDLGSSFAIESDGKSDTATRAPAKAGTPGAMDMEETRQQVRGSVAEAEMYVEYGLKKKAYKLLNKLLQQNPFDIKANRIFSDLCIERGEIAKASKCYLNMAESYLKKGKAEKAEKFLDKSDRLLPGSSSYLRKMLATQQLDDSMEEEEGMPFLELSDLEEPSVLEAEQLESIAESVEIDVHDMDDFSRAEEEHDSVSEDILFAESVDEVSVAGSEDKSGPEIELELPGTTMDLSDRAPFDTLELADLKEEEGSLNLEEPEEMEIIEEDSVILDSRGSEEQPLPDFNDLGLDLEKVEEEKTDATRVSGTAVDLTDELQEVDFYLSQNMVEEARDIIRTLELDHAGHPDLEKVKREVETAATMELDKNKDTQAPLEEMLQDEFIDLQAEFGEDLDMFSDNTELTDKQATEQVKSLDELFSEFKKGVEQQIDQEDYETHYNLGIAYKEMGLTNESIEEFAKASHDDHRFLDCCFMIANVYEEIGDIDQALEWLESGISRAESDGRDVKPLLYEAGRVLEAAGQKDRAKPYFQQVYDISPKFRDVAKKLK
ncbi:MAG: tetratricopeptide repeat protein [Acidobacteria bacterium]|nr:tetratricopeptide repeat protein [Acidobacteriota bacterium]